MKQANTLRMGLMTTLLRFGYNEVYSSYSDFKSSQWDERKEIRRAQEEQIQEMLQYSYDEVPFYRGKFKKASVHPDDFHSIQDITKYPTTTVNELKKAIAEGSIGEYPGPTKNLETTGSTGKPFVFPVDKQASAVRLGCKFRTAEWYGHYLGDRNARLWRTSSEKSIIDKIKENVFGRRLELSIYDADKPEESLLDENTLERFCADLRDYNPKVIDGYVSALVLLSDYIQKNNITGISPAAVVTGAENLSSVERGIISDAFGCDVYDRYGMSEVSFIAHECTESIGEYYHTMADKLYVEVLEEGDPVGPGEHGEIVVTDFTNKALPFIRYKTGDVGVAADPEKECDCGRGLPLLKSVEGRINDLFLLPSGEILVSHVWHKLFREYDEIEKFQVIQEERDEITVKIAAEDDTVELPNLKENVKSFLPGCTINWEVHTQLSPGPGGKFRHSISKVPFDLNDKRGTVTDISEISTRL